MPPKKKPLGKPLEWSDEEIERMSAITDADKAQAAERWREVASPKYKNLLDAEEIVTPND